MRFVTDYTEAASQGMLAAVGYVVTITLTPTREERRLRRLLVYQHKGVLLATLTKTFAHSVIRVRQEVNLYFCSSVKETCSSVLLSKTSRMANASGVMRYLRNPREVKSTP